MTGEELSSAILFRVRTRLCALPVPHVVETMRPLPVAPVASAPDFVLGASLIRGEVLPVVDVGALVGAKEPPASTRYIVVRAGQGRVALAVEAVLGIRALAPAARRKPPALLRDASAEIVAALGALDSELLTVLRLARTLSDSLLRTIAPGAAA